MNKPGLLYRNLKIRRDRSGCLNQV